MTSPLLRSRGSRGVRAVLLLVGLIASGCAGWSSNPALTLHVTSSVDRPLLIYVNDTWVGTIPARAGALDVPVAGSSTAPYAVQARTDKGRVLGTLLVSAAQAQDPAGVSADAVLTCGTLRLAVGSGVGNAGGTGPPPTAAPGAQTCD